jgi:hypothetical protein
VENSSSPDTKDNRADILVCKASIPLQKKISSNVPITTYLKAKVQYFCQSCAEGKHQGVLLYSTRGISCTVACKNDKGALD